MILWFTGRSISSSHAQNKQANDILIYSTHLAADEGLYKTYAIHIHKIKSICSKLLNSTFN